jgi:steroid delta-isomerase
MEALRRALASCCLLAAITGPPALAQPGGSAEATIRGALVKWTNDFNARDSSHICDLFAADLRYDYRGFPERDYAALCALLQRSLEDRNKTFTYSLDIKEVIVSGDLAVVRLVWTLKAVTAGSDQAEETKEPGLDVFRRQPDGTWKISRFVAYEAP